MKKILFVMSVACAMLFPSCGQDENLDQTTVAGGELIATINFEGVMAPRAASTTAVPLTSWDNVKKMQLFLYKSDGTVAFSAIISPTGNNTQQTFTWTNVPVGSYELAVVANIDAATDNVATSLDGGTSWTTFTGQNVVNKKINAEVFIDLKKSAFPAGHTFDALDVPYSQTSEIFTAYNSSVTITEGVKTNLSSTPLELKREISLLRVRIDKTDKVASAPDLSTVNFEHDKNFIAIHNMPKGIGLKQGAAFAGGIFADSDKNRIMIAANGTSTYNKVEATTGYSINPTDMIDAKFTLWKDIRVLPNASKDEVLVIAGDANAARKYFIVITGWAPVGYKYADETIAPAAQPVYWSGTINGVFSPNTIREVNLTITSRGYSTNPVDPDVTGGLEITVTAPEQWNNVIQSEEREI